MRWLESIIASKDMNLSKLQSKDMNLSKLQEIKEDREAWYAIVHGVVKSQTQLNDWTTTTTYDGQRSMLELFEENTGTEKHIKAATCSSEELTSYLKS